MKSIEELADEGLLQTSWESEVVQQQLYDVIVESKKATTVGRQVFQYTKIPGGDSMDIVVQDGSQTFRKIPPGADYPIDNESVTKITLTPDKWGNISMMTQEIEEDANWSILKMNMQNMGREAAQIEDFIIFSAMNDSTYGFPSTSGQYITTAGTELSVADIASAMEATESNNYEPDTLILHPTQLKELRQIDTFVEAGKYGSDEMMKNGFVGKIFGMSVYKTTNAYIRQTSSEYAWVLDSRYAGIYGEKRPLTMKTFELPLKDSLAVSASLRADAKILRPGAGCRITIQ